MASEKKYSIGIDLGGSKVNVGVLNENGEVLFKHKAIIRDIREPNRILDVCCNEVNDALKQTGINISEIRFIGMGVPGTVDVTKRKVLFAPNLSWENVEVSDYLYNRLNIDVLLVQDSRASAFAEYISGAGRDMDVVVCITLGTGISCGIIVNGTIFSGGFNTSGEIGHIIVSEDGNLCGCGKRGCLEAYSSGTAIVKAGNLATSLKPVKTAEEVFEKAKSGNPEAIGIIRTAVKYLGIGVVNVINTLSPNAVIFSGGMCEQETLLLDPVREFIMKNAYALAVDNGVFKVLKAQLGEDAPMIGAGMLYKS